MQFNELKAVVVVVVVVLIIIIIIINHLYFCYYYCCCLKSAIFLAMGMFQISTDTDEAPIEIRIWYISKNTEFMPFITLLHSLAVYQISTNVQLRLQFKLKSTQLPSC